MQSILDLVFFIILKVNVCMYVCMAQKFQKSKDKLKNTTKYALTQIFCCQLMLREMLTQVEKWEETT